MTPTPIEIFALVCILFAAIKIVVILMNPSSWADFIKKIWVNPILVSVVSLILAMVVLYYLLEVLTFSQIFAVILFVALLAALGVSAYSKEVIAMAVKISRDKDILKKALLPLIIWIVLILLGLKELFL